MRQTRPLRRLAAPALAAAIVASPVSALEWPDWQSAYYRDHPLVGSIWRGDGSAADGPALSAAVVGADYLLLGEIHTNPDHHTIQAMLIDAIAAAGRRPAIVFEMIPAGLQGRLDEYLAANPRDAAGLGAALDWQARGWPDWSIYQPVAAAALAAGLKLKAGDLDRDQLQRIGKAGAAALDAGLRRRLGLDRPLQPELEAALLETLKQSHCNLLPEAALGPMLAVQRARDGALADAMLAAGQADGAVLIAGAGHVRRDWAAAALIKARRADARTVAVALVEVEESHNAFTDYDLTRKGAGPAFDFVVFTPRSDLTDRCAELAERLGKAPPE